ncbi:MAG TPA: HNH endonuclease [Conexibacter sp.]|nr:HNH endonuclease [Conexibacter sp.]
MADQEVAVRKATNAVHGLTAEWLTSQLAARGMRPSELADAMGVSRALVCTWQSEKRIIDDGFADRIHAAMREYVPPPRDGWFWSKVDVAGPDECWRWTACCNPAGYGQGTRHRTIFRAHRASWEIHHGPIPYGLNACHNCDNPPCVNPAHLFLGTQQDNVHDMLAKGRDRLHFRESPPAGESNANAKLTADKVREIRTLYAAGGWRHADLAERFGISRALVSFITSGRAWRHVTHGEPVRRAA